MINWGKGGEVFKLGIVLPLLIILKLISPQKQMISKKCRKEVERMAEYEIVLNWCVLVSIVGQEVE